MSTAAPARRATALRDPLIAGVVAFVVSAVEAGTPSVDFDGAATVSGATRPLGDLWPMLERVDAVHGAYYLLMHPIFAVFGYSPLSLRLPSAIAIGAAAAIIVVLARQLGIGRFPLIAGLVFAVIPRVTWMGIEGRSGAVATLAVAASTLLLVRAARSRSVGWWVGYAAVAIAGCELFIFTWLVVVSHGIAVAVWARRSGLRGWAHPLLRWGLAATVVTIAIVPLVIRMLGQRNQVGWIVRFGLSDVPRVIRNQWFIDGPIAILGWILVIVAVVVWFRGSQRLVSLPLVLAGLLFPTFALVVTSMTVLPMWTQRYMGFCTPFLALAIAGGIGAFRRWWMQSIVLLLFVGLAVPAYLDQRTTVSGDGTDWRAVAEQITAARDDVSTAVAFATLDNGTTSRAMQVAYPAAFEGMRDVTIDRTAQELGLLFASEVPLAEGRLDGVDELFVLASHPAELPGWRVVDTWESVRLVVTKLERVEP